MSPEYLQEKYVGRFSKITSERLLLLHCYNGKARNCALAVVAGPYALCGFALPWHCVTLLGKCCSDAYGQYLLLANYQRFIKGRGMATPVEQDLQRDLLLFLFPTLATIL